VKEDQIAEDDTEEIAQCLSLSARELVEWHDESVGRTVSAMYESHYRPMVRLASLLVRDGGEAEAIVQDSFAALQRKRRRDDAEFAVTYLRQSVVRRSRSMPRRGTGPGPPAAGAGPGSCRAGPGQAAAGEHSAVISALGRLPGRQREALVLRHYADLPVAQIASTMGVSPRAARGYLARGRATLGGLLDGADP